MMVIAVVLVTASLATAQVDDKMMNETRGIAAESLKSFQMLVIQQKNYREMGFESPEELDKMTLGDPLQVFKVRLDQLKEYQPGSDPNKLLTGGDQFTYPVFANNQLRSSITVARTEGGWKAVSFGSPTRVRLISKARPGGGTEGARIQPAGSFVVEIPAFNLVFVGHQAEGTLMLTPVLDNASLGLQAGVSLPADRVFTTMIPAAKAHNGQPS